MDFYLHLAGTIAFYAFAFLCVIGPAIFIHELGHFLFAKRYGVKVYTFALGFGPRVWSRTWGGTEYCICWIPLGGYVKMAGEDPGEARHGDPDEFAAKPVGQRAMIILAGPLFNIVSGFLLCIFIGLVGIETAGILPRIGAIGAESPLQNARVGDVIEAIDGQPVSSWTEIELAARAARGRSITLALRRDTERLTLQATPVPLVYPEGLDWPSRLNVLVDNTLLGDGTLWIGPWVEPVIGKVTAEGAAALSGLRDGDRILAINDSPVTQWTEFASGIRSATASPLTVDLERDGRRTRIRVSPKTTYAQTGDGSIVASHAIGVAPVMMVQSLGPAHAVASAGVTTIKMGRLILVTLQKLILGEVSAKLLAGPLGIAQGSGRSLREGGAMNLVYFLALISINLGVVNLIPFPLLDGGWLFIFLLYEALARRPMPQKVQERLMQAGIAALLALVVFITYNDLGRMLGFQTVDDVMKGHVAAPAAAGKSDTSEGARGPSGAGATEAAPVEASQEAGGQP